MDKSEILDGAECADMPTLSIAIVIVNFRTSKLIKDCLISLKDEICDFPATEVVVCDNDSQDGSAQRLDAFIVSRGYSWVKLVKNERNGGFSYGNNVGIRHLLAKTSPPDLIWLLNPDTVVFPGALRSIIQFMVSHQGSGIASTRIVSEGGEAESSARRKITPFSEFLGSAQFGLLDRRFRDHVVAIPAMNYEHRCDWVSGASLVMRREVIDEVGLMDEGFFLYFEEVDLCHRAGLAGKEIWYMPSATVMHLEGASTGLKAPCQRRAPYWYNSRRRLLVKMHGKGGLFLADLGWATGRLLMKLRCMLGMRQAVASDPLWFAADLLWGDLRAAWDGSLGRIERYRHVAKE